MNTLHTGMILAAGLLGLTMIGEARADSYDRDITLINGSHQTITHFYASNVGSRSWEEDILHGSVLPPGRSVVINMDDGTGYCHFDFKTVTRFGPVVRPDVDVCGIETYTLTD